MSSDIQPSDPHEQRPAATQGDEGGLHAPPGLSFGRRLWWWFDFLILVNLARFRFIAILAAIGIVITQWGTLTAYYDKWTRPESAVVTAADKNVEYFCPMHPNVVRDRPSEKCPICFMPLSKRAKGAADADPLPAGAVSRVQLSPYRIVLAGVQTSRVEYLPLTKQIGTVGYVEFNERGQRKVSARVKGRIDKLLVNETGQMVHEGDVLASLYSADLIVTVQNLLDAQRRGQSEYLADARQRLALLGIDRAQIDEIATGGKPVTHLDIRSPIAGHVIQKYVREGDYVEEGMPLYDVADLSTVWIQAQLYEDDFAFLDAPGSRPAEADAHEQLGRGLPVTATTRAFPGEEFKGTLAFVYPHVDQATRTVTVRFELDNPGHRLRPGATARVRLDVPPREIQLFKTAAAGDPRRYAMLEEDKLPAVPESSVIDTGRQQIVYREAKPGVYEGIEVELGPTMTGPDDVAYFPVLRGLDEGDLIVTSGAFLVDAETRLNPAAGSIYFGGSGGGTPAASSVTAVRPSTPDDPDAQIVAALAKLAPEDRQAAVEQRFCAVLGDSRLGGMGTPVKLPLGEQSVFLCCDGCKETALASPEETLANAARLREGGGERDEGNGVTHD